MKTFELLEKLSKKYPSPQYGFITQVKNGTGCMATRTADAIAMSLWPSRGLELIGFELKVSRSDWLTELKNPQKAEEIMSYCDRWYLVVSDKDIVKTGELPPTWGLMRATGRGMRVEVEAPELKPVELDRLFLAGIFRNICEKMIAKELIQKKIDESYKRGIESVGYTIDGLKEENKRLKNSIRIFEVRSGIKIFEWEESNNELGDAVKEVLSGKNKRAKEELVKLRKTALNIAKFIDGKIEPYII